MSRAKRVQGNTPPLIKAYNLAKVKLSHNHPDDWKKLLSSVKLLVPNKSRGQQRSMARRALIAKYQDEYDTLLENARIVFGVEVSAYTKINRARQLAELEALEMLQNKSDYGLVKELLERTSK
jgi:hypothetical protein